MSQDEHLFNSELVDYQCGVSRRFIKVNSRFKVPLLACSDGA